MPPRSFASRRLFGDVIVAAFEGSIVFPSRLSTTGAMVRLVLRWCQGLLKIDAIPAKPPSPVAECAQEGSAWHRVRSVESEELRQS
jgi:hypothetical protein